MTPYTKAEITWPQLGFSEEITSSWENGPRNKTEKILDRALYHVNSIDYKVTLRWLFYRLFQEGYFSDKKPGMSKDGKVIGAKKRAYQDFTSLMSRLRHSPIEFQEKWPIELADDRRDPIHRTQGFETPDEWLEWQRENIKCNIDKMVDQDFYIMVAFEAEAMQSQFIKKTENYEVSLWPFSGAASIPYKKRLAHHIEWAHKKFNLPVVLLYFGDHDDAGLIIPESAFRHVRKWCSVDFDAYRVGLNKDQVIKYNVEDDPERPGKYQWEAVDDKDATEIITSALNMFLYHGTISEHKRVERIVTQKVRDALINLDSDWGQS